MLQFGLSLSAEEYSDSVCECRFWHDGFNSASASQLRNTDALFLTEGAIAMLQFGLSLSAEEYTITAAEMTVPE